MPKENALIEVRLAGLANGEHAFEFTCNAGDFDDAALTEAGFRNDIEVSVVVDKRDSELIVMLTTIASAELSCDLCLAPVSIELKGSYRLYYVYENGPDAGEGHDEEYRLIDRNTLSIDLTEDARETLLLSVPMKVTCTDNPECRVYRAERENRPDAAPESGSWQESLEKLKNKYR